MCVSVRKIVGENVAVKLLSFLAGEEKPKTQIRVPSSTQTFKDPERFCLCCCSYHTLFPKKLHAHCKPKQRAWKRGMQEEHDKGACMRYQSHPVPRCYTRLCPHQTLLSDTERKQAQGKRVRSAPDSSSACFLVGLCPRKREMGPQFINQSCLDRHVPL